MAVESVIAFLEKLPKAAWPYGLVVGVQETGIRSGDDDVLIKRNTKALLSQLRKSSVMTNLWPSG